MVQDVQDFLKLNIVVRKFRSACTRGVRGGSPFPAIMVNCDSDVP